jgi:hypothetical protein
LGGWGLKNIFLFSKALAAKSGWRLLKTTSLWTRVVFQKYIAPDTLEGWIINPSKERTGVSVIWKAVTKSFSIIGEGLAWMIGNDHRVRLGVDPWPGCDRQHLLPDHIIDTLRMRGVSTLNQIAYPRKPLYGLKVGNRRYP